MKPVLQHTYTGQVDLMTRSFETTLALQHAKPISPISTAVLNDRKMLEQHIKLNNVGHELSGR